MLSHFWSCQFQIEIFRGDENIITMTQTHSKKFHCIYLLHYYPFDTQVNCVVAFHTCISISQLFRFAMWGCKLRSLTSVMWNCLQTKWTCYLTQSSLNITFNHGVWTITTQVIYKCLQILHRLKNFPKVPQMVLRWK